MRMPKEGWSGDIFGNASLVSFPPKRDNDGRAYLPLIYSFPIGKEIDINQDSILVRPFRRVLEKAKPVGTINYIFYQDNNDYYVLGAFAYTGKRIVFFPGTIDRRMTISPDGTEILEKGTLQHIDHLSLENNLRTYHITLLEKETVGAKYKKLNTRRVKDDMFLWFVMSIQDAAKLEPAPVTQEIRLKWDNLADLRRRYSIINNARGDCIFNVTFVDDEPKEQYFINFEFFVSLNKAREYTPPLELYHTGLVPTTQMKDQRSK